LDKGGSEGQEQKKLVCESNHNEHCSERIIMNMKLIKMTINLQQIVLNEGQKGSKENVSEMA
jgi:hypothetical protein